MPAKNDDVQTGQLGLEPESFPYTSLDAIALYGKFQVFLGKHQTDPGVSQRIGCRQDQKIPVWNSDSYVVEDFAVIAGFQ